MKRCKKSNLPYELGKETKKAEEDSDSDDSSIIHRIRQMEPLYIGDVVEHQHPMNMFDPKNLITAMVSSIDRKERKVTMNTGVVLETVQYLRRIHCYDPKKNTMVEQYGAIRSVDSFDLINVRPEVNSLVMEDCVQRGKRIIRKNKKRLRSNLEKDNLPSDLID